MAATQQITETLKSAAVGDILTCKTSMCGAERTETLQVTKRTRSSVTLRDVDLRLKGTMRLVFTSVNAQGFGYRVWLSVEPLVVH